MNNYCKLSSTVQHWARCTKFCPQESTTERVTKNATSMPESSASQHSGKH